MIFPVYWARDDDQSCRAVVRAGVHVTAAKARDGAPSPAAALLRPSVVGSAAAGNARRFASSSGDGPLPPEEEHVVIWNCAPAVVDRWEAECAEGDVCRMDDVVQRWNGKQSAPLCRDCLPEKTVHANYKDEDGVTQLCAAAGTYSVDNLCRGDCPEDAKLDAMYEDEDGKAKQLCTTHARAAGTHVVQRPCRDCPEDAKIQANNRDEDGKTEQLCATHAHAVGTCAKGR